METPADVLNATRVNSTNLVEEDLPPKTSQETETSSPHRASTEPPSDDNSDQEDVLAISPMDSSSDEELTPAGRHTPIKFTQDSPRTPEIRIPTPKLLPRSNSCPAVKLELPLETKNEIVVAATITPVTDDANKTSSLATWFGHKLENLKSYHKQIYLSQREDFIAQVEALAQKFLKDQLNARQEQLFALDVLLNELLRYEAQISLTQHYPDIRSTAIAKLDAYYASASIALQLTATTNTVSEAISHSASLLNETRTSLEKFDLVRKNQAYLKRESDRHYHTQISDAAKAAAHTIIQQDRADSDFSSLMRNVTFIYKRKIAIQKSFRNPLTNEYFDTELSQVKSSTLAICATVANNDRTNALKGIVDIFLGTLKCLTVVGLYSGIKQIKSGIDRISAPETTYNLAEKIYNSNSSHNWIRNQNEANIPCIQSFKEKARYQAKQCFFKTKAAKQKTAYAAQDNLHKRTVNL